MLVRCNSRTMMPLSIMLLLLPPLGPDDADDDEDDDDDDDDEAVDDDDDDEDEAGEAAADDEALRGYMIDFLLCNITRNRPYCISPCRPASVGQ